MNGSESQFRRYLGAYLFFIAAIVVIGFVASEIIYWRLGETRVVSRFVGMADTPYLYGPGYYQHGNQKFKFEMARRLRPEILVMGSSRVMQFREQSFRGIRPSTDGRVFYNAGSVFTPWDFLTFDAKLGASGPRMIILGIDTFAMTERPGVTQALLKRGWTRLAIARLRVQAWFRQFSAALGNRKLFLADIFQWGPLLGSAEPRSPHTDERLFGVAARKTQSGFRNDGSFSYGAHVTHRFGGPAPKRDVEELDRLVSGRGSPFVTWQGVSEFKIHLLEQSIRRLAEREVRIALVMPPYSKRALQRFDETPDLAPTLVELPVALKQLAERVPGVSFFDFSRAESAGCLEEEEFDFFHMSEKCYARLSLAMARDPNIRPFIDEKRISTALAASKNPGFVYPPVEPTP